MAKGRLTILAILGFIIGGAGLGVGAYSYYIFSDQIARLQNGILKWLVKHKNLIK